MPNFPRTALRLRGDDVRGEGFALNWRHSRVGGNPVTCPCAQGPQRSPLHGNMYALRGAWELDPSSIGSSRRHRAGRHPLRRPVVGQHLREAGDQADDDAEL